MRIVDANFYAKDLVHAFFACLYVARQEIRLLVDLFDYAEEKFFRRKSPP